MNPTNKGTGGIRTATEAVPPLEPAGLLFRLSRFSLRLLQPYGRAQTDYILVWNHLTVVHYLLHLLLLVCCLLLLSSSSSAGGISTPAYYKMVFPTIRWVSLSSSTSAAGGICTPANYKRVFPTIRWVSFSTTTSSCRWNLHTCILQNYERVVH